MQIKEDSQHERTLSALMVVLFVLTALYPVGALATAVAGFRFELVDVSGFAIALATLSACAVVLDLVFKPALENDKIRILLALAAPLSLMSGTLCVLACAKLWMLVSVCLFVASSCYLTAKYGEPPLLKIVVSVLTALMITPVIIICFFAISLESFGSFGQTTVARTVESPNGTHYAQVVDSDQGALGGETFIDVYQSSGIDALLFKIEKNPQRVYYGSWGEAEYLHVVWKDENHLIIGSTEYEIE